MQPPRPPRPDLKLPTVLGFPDELFVELASSVRGPVVRPSDAKYSERAKTFNGKLKPNCYIVVSPLDAQDVSAVVRFSLKHGLSPSVRAGGFGIAGWAVAGDVIIDLSMIKDIDIEPPRPGAEDGSPDWIPLKDMLPPGSKGKSRQGNALHVVASRTDDSVSSAVAGEGANKALPSPPFSPATGAKRRRDDRSPSPPPPPPPLPDHVGTAYIGPYDHASPAVASFLRGPPLPPEPGETPRQPPVHQPRDFAQRPPEKRPKPDTADDNDIRSRLPIPPPLDERTRQISSESAASSNGTDSSSRFSTATSATSATTPLDEKSSSGSGPGAAEPFGYLAPGSAPPAHLPMYGGPPASTTAPAQGVTAFPPPFGMPTSSPPGPALGVTVWNAATGFSSIADAGRSFASMPGFMPGMAGMSAMPSGMLPMPGQPFPLGMAMSMSTMMPPFGGPANPFSNMHAVADPHAKPVHPHAYVTFGAGMRQKEVDLYTADHPLEGISAVTNERQDAAVPYHVPMSAHPVGSAIMLLAGFGFISRMYGLSIDNLVEVEMVLADGRIVIANAEKDPDLWWAIRGAGPAFGIATRYKVRAFPVPVVFAGNLIYRFHRATAPSLIKHFRDCIKNAPRELYANLLLTAGPADKDSLVVIQMCYVGPKEKGAEYLQAISSWEGERCLLNEVNEKSYLNHQDSIAQVLRGKAGRQWFLRSSLITTLPDEVINKTVIEFSDTPIGCTWIFELAGGAIGDFEDNCLPKEQREATWTVAALHQWDMGIDDLRCVTTAEEWMQGTISLAAVGGPYPTFLGRHESPERTMACYGKNWARLAELKRKYDPQCFFKNNFWPLDKDGHPIAELTNEPPSP